MLINAEFNFKFHGICYCQVINKTTHFVVYEHLAISFSINDITGVQHFMQLGKQASSAA